MMVFMRALAPPLPWEEEGGRGREREGERGREGGRESEGGREGGGEREGGKKRMNSIYICTMSSTLYILFYIYSFYTQI